MELVNNNMDLGLMLVQVGQSMQEQSHENKRLENEVASLSIELNNVLLKQKEILLTLGEYDNKIDELTSKTSKITDTLMSNNDLKRRLENKIHSAIYRELPKGSLRCDLFYGSLSARCKRHLTSTMNVNKFDLIMQDDVPTCETLVNKFLTKSTIHSLMRKDASRLFKESQKSKADNMKRIGTGNGRKFILLDKLLEEVGGDINAI